MGEQKRTIKLSPEERFNEAIEKDAQIYYTWDILNLKPKDLNFLQQSELDGKTLCEAASCLEVNAALDEEANGAKIFKTKVDEEERTFTLYIAMPGTLRKHYPLMTALYEKFPYTHIQFSAFQHNINSYRAFGGPWVGGMKQSDLAENHMYLIYYLSKYRNTFASFNAEENQDVMNYIGHWASEEPRWIRYRVIPWHKAKIVNIDCIEKEEYFTNQKKEAERKEAERKEAERKEAERKEAERKEAERKEAKRKEAERKEAERKEAERKEAERKEAERKEAERKEAERKEAERKEAERKEAERKEAERKEAERKEAERKEAERKEAERKEAEVSSESEEESYFSDRLEKLIAAAISDGVLTEKEKEIILRRAVKEGEDEDEVMMMIESRLKKMKKK